MSEMTKEQVDKMVEDAIKSQQEARDARGPNVLTQVSGDRHFDTQNKPIDRK
jgi:hypothetical protein